MIEMVKKEIVLGLSTIKCGDYFLFFNFGEGYTLANFGEDDLKKARISSSSFKVEKKLIDGIEVVVFEIPQEDKSKAVDVVKIDVPRWWFNSNGGQCVVSNAKLTYLAEELIKNY